MAGSLVNRFQLQFFAIQETMVKQGPLGKFSRIDRVLVNHVWVNRCPEAVLQTVHSNNLDHKPIVWAKKLSNWGPKPFRFNNLWLSKKGSLEFCEAKWTGYEVEGWAAFILNKKIRLLKSDLRAWNVNQRDHDEYDHSNCLRDIKNLKELLKIRTLSEQEVAVLAFLKLMKKNLTIRIESKRRLHSRYLWLKLVIFSPVNTASLPSVSPYGPIIMHVNWAELNVGRIPVHLLSGLEASFTTEEIVSLIKMFDGNKTPGPDGFSLQFFKKAWFFLEDIVVEMLNDFHNNSMLPKGFNSSFIVLIPKSNSAKSIDQLRPISLINAPYKIIAKILANRLKKVIPFVISENQNCFVPSRLLMDGVMVVSEVVNYAKKKKKPIILLKIDFSKAYDCVSHEFLFTGIFDCKVGSFSLHYLGIPIGLSRNRTTMWSPIIDKFKKKLPGWKGRCLSFGGRLVMINAVLSNLPLHYMSLYKVPSSVLKQLDRYRRNFLWGGHCLKKKTCLVKWEAVCFPKELGGLGITPLRLKKLAMLAKWWVWLNSDKQALWKSIVVASFGPSFRGKLMNNVSSLCTSQLSPIWKDLINLQNVDIAQSIIGSNIWRWKVGDGACILFCYDSWVDGRILKDDFPSLFFICEQKMGSVKQFRYPSNIDEQQLG
ncbi:uncharacterized protein [Rutidosis leptorrhynchoides]|uniref:uncharacterized protein n=1 Tax=Rutidosis leptorrhynchoides TaxID=125765 RepID=UPI003A990CF5